MAQSVPYSTSITHQGLIVFDQKGREMWRHSVPAPIIFRDDDPPERHGFSLIADLNGDGTPKVLFSPHVAAVADRVLWCFDLRGRLLWEFKPGRTVTTRSGESLAPPYGVSGVHILPPDSAGRRRIIVLSNHHLFFPCQVAMLDHQGRILREYWHSGNLSVAATQTVGGKLVLLLGGISNSTHEATVVALDPETMDGASKEANPEYQINGMPESTDLIRWLFPRSCINKQLESMNEIAEIRVASDGFTASAREHIALPNTPDILYHFDPNLIFKSAAVSSAFSNEHARLARSNILDHELTQAEMYAFLPYRP